MAPRAHWPDKALPSFRPDLPAPMPEMPFLTPDWLLYSMAARSLMVAGLALPVLVLA